MFDFSFESDDLMINIWNVVNSLDYKKLTFNLNSDELQRALTCDQLNCGYTALYYKFIVQCTITFLSESDELHWRLICHPLKCS